ncbi:MAG: GNAT family N-acetyltransferase [Acholeplasmataceae bacterium]|jgi:ElaA protein|nr:GNAT family N-acetyltransferase [Acholeplasmataceae bacterium]
MSLRIVKKSFQDLTNQEVYDLLDIRLDVFVTEQHILYTDTDYKDQDSIHYLLYDQNQVISYLRLIKPGYKYDEYSIGRVATRLPYRNKGYATKLLIEAKNDIKGHPIRISAQAYLKDYYLKLGFIPVGEPYIEEGILHVEMLAIND